MENTISKTTAEEILNSHGIYRYKNGGNIHDMLFDLKIEKILAAMEEYASLSRLRELGEEKKWISVDSECENEYQSCVFVKWVKGQPFPASKNVLTWIEFKKFREYYELNYGFSHWYPLPSPPKEENV